MSSLKEEDLINILPKDGPTVEETIKYLQFSGRDKHTISLVKSYAKEQGLWADNDIEFSDILELNRNILKEGNSLILTLVKNISNDENRFRRIYWAVFCNIIEEDPLSTGINVP